MNQLKQLKKEAQQDIQNHLHYRNDDLFCRFAIAKAFEIIDKAYQAGKMENPCIEHCSEPSCPECNMAAYKAGQQAERKLISQEAFYANFTDEEIQHLANSKQ